MSKSAYEKWKRNEPLTRAQAMGAECYECNGYSVEKKADCLGKDCCPLYQWSTWGRSLVPRASKSRVGNLRKKTEGST